MESAAILARSYINVKEKTFTCRSAIVDLGLFNTDPGLAPNGAKCGKGKVFDLFSILIWVHIFISLVRICNFSLTVAQRHADTFRALIFPFL